MVGGRWLGVGGWGLEDSSGWWVVINGVGQRLVDSEWWLVVGG